MRTIVVGVDRSYAARVVAGWAARLAAVVDAEVVEVHAFPDPSPEVGPEELDRLMALREADLEQRCVEDAEARGARARLVVRSGDARQVIGQIADDEAADLVVLGRSGEGADAEESRLGTVAEHLAHHWSGSLAVVPSLHVGPVTRIVLGVDGSPESLAAVSWCTLTAPALDADVVVVRAQELGEDGSPGGAAADWRRAALKELQEWTVPLVEAGVRVELVVSEDRRPVDALLGAVSAYHADVLLLGRRGAGGFPGLRSGGIALAALQRAPVPVILVADRPA